MTTHRREENGDKVGIRLAMRDWITIGLTMAALIGYFVRIEMQVRDIATMKADIKDHEKRITQIEARHAARIMGPSRGDRDR